MHKYLDKIRICLGHPMMPAFAVLLALVLTLPILKNGFCLDDNYHRLVFKGDKRFVAAEASPLNLFCFENGTPQDSRKRNNSWVISEKVKVYFFRPISSLSHWLDYMLWPNNPALMHGQSLLWLAALVLCTGLFYRLVTGAGWVAGAAAVFFSVDYIHGVVTGWLSNRNALLAGVFCMLCLICHNRWRLAGWRAGAYLGPLSFVLSLLSAEAGIATCAYLFAHALFLEQGSLRSRFTGLVPYGIILVVWRIFYTVMGFGAENIFGFYIDPLKEPLAYLSAIALRAPLYLMGQMGTLPITPTMYIIPSVLQKASFVFIALLGIVAVPLLRRQRTVRFWSTGLLLCLLPICAVNADERNLLFAGIGAAGLMAHLLACIQQTNGFPLVRVWRWAALVLAGQFILIHVVCSPALYMIKNSSFAFSQYAVDKAAGTLPVVPAGDTRKIIIVNNPLPMLFVISVNLTNALHHQAKPVYDLTGGSVPLVINRLDPQTLTIRAERGALFEFPKIMMPGTKNMMKPGDRIDLDSMSMQALDLFDGQPSAASFRFSVPLEDESLLWFCWDETGYVRFTPPAVGETVTLKPAVWNFKKTRESYRKQS